MVLLVEPVVVAVAANLQELVRWLGGRQLKLVAVVVAVAGQPCLREDVVFGRTRSDKKWRRSMDARVLTEEAR